MWQAGHKSGKKRPDVCIEMRIMWSKENHIERGGAVQHKNGRVTNMGGSQICSCVKFIKPIQMSCWQLRIKTWLEKNYTMTVWIFILMQISMVLKSAMKCRL